MAESSERWFMVDYTEGLVHIKNSKTILICQSRFSKQGSWKIKEMFRSETSLATTWSKPPTLEWKKTGNEKQVLSTNNKSWVRKILVLFERLYIFKILTVLKKFFLGFSYWQYGDWWRIICENQKTKRLEILNSKSKILEFF